MRRFFEKRLKPAETVIVIILIALMINLITSRYDSLSQNAKIKSVRMDLNNVHLLIRLYRIQERGYPARLNDLVDKGYMELNERNEMTTGKSMLIDGQIVDAFGHAYQYDNRTGSVSLNDATLSIINKEQE